MNSNLISFIFDFLEPNRFIKVYIDYIHEETIEANIHGKLIGSEEINYKVEADNKLHHYYIGKKSADANLLVFPFMSIAFFWLGSQLFMKMFQLTLFDLKAALLQMDKFGFMIIVIGFIWLLLSLLIGWNIRRYFTPFVHQTEKVKLWYTKFSKTP